MTTYIVITVEGGMIQGITAAPDEADVRVVVLDYDVEGREVPKIRIFTDKTEEACNIYESPVGHNHAFVDWYFDELEKVTG
jgi:hypothetical protein